MLPVTLRKDIDWGTGDAVVVYVVDKNTVILHMTEKSQNSETSTLIID